MSRHGASRAPGGDLGDERAALCLLAGRHNVDTAYVDAFGEERQVSDETLVGVLGALGEPISSPRDARAVLDGEAARPGASGAVSIPAVIVAWDGVLPPVPVGPTDALHAFSAQLALEDGGDAAGLLGLAAEGPSTVLRAAGELPFGIHELAIGLPQGSRAPGQNGAEADRAELEEITVISSPSRIGPLKDRSWGVFAPVYALFDPRLGAQQQASFTCLETLGRFAAQMGASYVATLPVLADLSDSDGAQSGQRPYSPISRMWWDESYLDPAAVPELDGASLGATRLEAGGRVDVRVRAAALRPHLARAAETLRHSGGRRLERFHAFVAERPDVVTYASFRAACESAGPDPSRWPDAWRHGLIDEGELDQEAVAAHIFAQFATDEQVRELARSIGSQGAGLMLDLPVGCRADGFDPWAYPDSFARGASIGAPPDMFFSSGQDWGFRPLHPEGERFSGYEVTQGALQHLLAHASALRLDHAMGLARLWWIPEGMSASEGAYVRYHLEELLALCCLEAHRHGAGLVGEDLGTVERSLTESLADHGVAGMHVAVFDLESRSAHPMEPLSPRAGSVALVDTHDTATFAGWFTGADIDDRLAIGLVDEAGADTERDKRKRAVMTLVDRLVACELLDPAATGDPVAVHAGLVRELGQSEAGLVLVNLEDCWGELDPQNVPGTTTEHANFCRPLSRDLAAIESDEAVASTLSGLEAARQTADPQVSDTGEISDADAG